MSTRTADRAGDEIAKISSHMDDALRAMASATEAATRQNLPLFAADMRETSAALMAAAGAALAAAVVVETAP